MILENIKAVWEKIEIDNLVLIAVIAVLLLLVYLKKTSKKIKLPYVQIPKFQIPTMIKSQYDKIMKSDDDTESTKSTEPENQSCDCNIEKTHMDKYKDDVQGRSSAESIGFQVENLYVLNDVKKTKGVQCINE